MRIFSLWPSTECTRNKIQSISKFQNHKITTELLKTENRLSIKSQRISRYIYFPERTSHYNIIHFKVLQNFFFVFYLNNFSIFIANDPLYAIFYISLGQTCIFFFFHSPFASVMFQNVQTEFKLFPLYDLYVISSGKQLIAWPTNISILSIHFTFPDVYRGWTK